LAMGYIFMLRPRTQRVIATVPPAPVKTTPAVQTAPATTVTPPTTPAPATATPPAATETTALKPPEAPPKIDVVPKHEPVGRPAAPKVGQLAISANVTGAKITVDGRSDPGWVTPNTIADLPAGAHNVRISTDGYDVFQQSVMVAAGQTANVAANLTVPVGELDVITDPAGVEVLVDGKSSGPSPIHVTLPPGNHTFTVKWSGIAPTQSSVVLKGGLVITRRLTLH
jgi:PEGA domain